MSDAPSKKCAICGVNFPKKAHGPWCHACVTSILGLLATNQYVVEKLIDTVERLRNQLRKAKAEGKTPADTDVPGPYWGLEL